MRYIFVLILLFSHYIQADTLSQYKEYQKHPSKNLREALEMSVELTTAATINVFFLPSSAYKMLSRVALDSPFPFIIFTGAAAIIVPIAMTPVTSVGALLTPLIIVPPAALGLTAGAVIVKAKSIKRKKLVRLIKALAKYNPENREEVDHELKNILKDRSIKKLKIQDEDLLNRLKMAYEKDFFVKDKKPMSKKEIIESIKDGSLEQFIIQS